MQETEPEPVEEPGPEPLREVEAEPRLVFDAVECVVALVLPAVPAPSGIAEWRLRFDGEEEVVVAADEWSDTVSRQVVWPVPRPVRSVAIALQGTRLRTELSLVDPSLPLLAFTEQGRALPQDRVRDSRQWMLHPEATDLVTDGSVTAIAEAGIPLHAWSGWRLRLVELLGATRLGLGGFTAERKVNGEAAKASLAMGEALFGITTSDGTPVYADPPTVLLPADSNAVEDWEIQVSSFADEATEQRSTAFPSRMWNGFRRPLFGRFAVSVHGPRGRGFHERAFTLAEGIAAHPSAKLRRIDDNGLTPATVTVKFPVGVTIADGGRVSFGPDETTRKVLVQVDGESLTFKASIPWITYSIDHPRISPVMRRRKAKMKTADLLNQPGKLSIAVPGAEGPGEVHLVQGTEVVQSSGPIKPRKGVYRVDLAVFNDTLRLFGHALLVFEDPEGGYSTIASFQGTVSARAPRFSSAASWPDSNAGGETLADELDQIGGIPEDLRAWLITDEPEPVLDAGPPAEPPRAVQTTLPDPPGEVEPASPIEPDRVEAWLDSVDHFSRKTDDFLPLWDALAEDLKGRFTFEKHAAAVLAGVRAQRHEAMDDLLDAELDADDQTRILVASGLAAMHHRFRKEATPRLWRRSPATAVLVDDLQGPTGRRRAAVPRAVCGPKEFNSVFNNPASDLHAELGRLDGTSDLLAALDDEALATYGASSNDDYTLLSPASRLAAARELASRHRDPLLIAAAASAPEAIAAVRGQLDGYLQRHLAQRAHPRPTQPWHHLAHFSTAMALAARRAARGDDACGRLAAAHHLAWTRLAARAPRLVTLDLVIAELLMTGTGLE